MIFGVDYLGGNKYQKQLLEAHRRGDCAGIFLNTFGNARAIIQKMMVSEKFCEIVVHLSPFDKAHSYPISKYRKDLKRQVAWASKLQTNHPLTKLLLSPFAEHRHSSKEMTPLFQELHSIAPNCLFVNSILDGGEEVFLPYVWTEIHIENTTPRKQPKHQHTISFDGFGGDCLVDFFTANIRGIVASFPNARHMRGWNFRCNCKRDCRDTTPIPDRTAYPDVAYLKKIRSKF